MEEKGKRRKTLVTKKCFSLRKEIMGMEQIWGKGNPVVNVEAAIPVIFWVDTSRRKNTEVGSVREIRAEGCYWPLQHRKCWWRPRQRTEHEEKWS